MFKTKTMPGDQKGVVSILVTMIMMLVISLIIIGFAQVARHNQRESLDRQLSTQAFYSAESGVNVAANYIANNGSSLTDTLSTGQCTNPIGSTPGAPQAPIALGNGDATTCLMTNPTPPSLLANPVTQDSNVVWHVLNNNAPVPFNSLTFTWSNNSSYSGANTCSSPVGKLPSYGTWQCSFGILRVDLVNTASVSQANLLSTNNNWTIYLVPRGTTAGPTPLVSNPLGASSAQVVNTLCSTTTKQCSIKITGLGSPEYYARISMVYQDSDSVSLTASDPAGGAKFKDGQAIVDATGVSQDESKRVQVRVPLRRIEGVLPMFGLESTDSICKQQNAAPGIYNNNCP